MTGNRLKGAPSKGTWVWVAVAAITFASFARAQSGIESARAYAAPVIKFLAGTPLSDSSVSASAHRSALPARSNVLGFTLNLLPVCFVGLVVPLSQYSARFSLSLGCAFPAPNLPSLFQRPPPALA